MKNLAAEHYFATLGARVERLWKDRQYEEAAFPDVAHLALVEAPPHQCISFTDVVKMGLFAEQLPYQSDIAAEFGQPPLTVYSGGEFRIEVLFWAEGAPSIHQHGFSGAFHVLHGSSLHTLWKFERHERINSHLLYGCVTFEHGEMLSAGQNRSIYAGENFIHATYHLDRPSATVVVRTCSEAERLPQYSYLPPSIAYDASQLSPLIQRRLQLLRMLVAANRRSDFGEALKHLFEVSDTYSAFHYLLEAHRLTQDQSERFQLFSAARRRHSRLMEICLPALFEQERRDRMLKLRRSIVNPDLQFFLALVLNVPRRSAMFELIRQRYHGRDPVRAIQGWMHELSEMGALEARFPESWLFVLRGLLAGCDYREILIGAGQEYGPASIYGHEEEWSSVVAGLRKYWLLAPLLTAEPALLAV